MVIIPAPPRPLHLPEPDITQSELRLWRRVRRPCTFLPGCCLRVARVVMPSGSQIPPFYLLFLLGDVAFSVCLEHLPVHPEAHSPRRLRGLCLTDHFPPLSVHPPGSDLFVLGFPPVETLLVAGTGCAQITGQLPLCPHALLAGRRPCPSWVGRWRGLVSCRSPCTQEGGPSFPPGGVGSASPRGPLNPPVGETEVLCHCSRLSHRQGKVTAMGRRRGACHGYAGV